MRVAIIYGLLMIVAGVPLSAQSTNHLGNEQSPYLQRAATQTVDWYPFGAQAFRRARELDRPVLLDVGAIWCPWCARMDRESYVVPETAAFINKHFVAVKVDYDAQPRLVAQLQRAQAVVNLPVGLPLTSFIAPDGTLYYGAGYVSDRHKGDKLSFTEILTEALHQYRDKETILKNGYKLRLEEMK